VGGGGVGPKIFHEKLSGKGRDRPQLDRMLKGLVEGDVLIITRLDRLARSTRDLLNLIKQIADAGATFKSLKDGRVVITSGLSSLGAEFLQRLDDRTP
jgi:DNA invertase Pin-like site-specific DNA recombinase